MLRLVIILILFPVVTLAKQPIGFKHWRLDDITFVKNIGGTVRNYQGVDKTWDSIVNAFQVEGDSVVYVDKSVLRTRVNKEGTSKVMLTWGGQEYTITQKLLGIGWLKISTRQSQWIDSTMSWSNFSLDSNICKWTGISPGIDYRVRKTNGRVEHGIFYKPAFLDSAVTLYNQRPDSLDIALANVMVYTLSANIDNADSAMGELSWRKLKDFGYYGFSLSEQWLRFPGSDTLSQIPVRQYWEIRGTKIICIEYVMMRWVKQVHEAYPSATVWHNDTKKIEGTTNVEDARIYSTNPDYNYGSNQGLRVEDVWSTLIRVKNVASELGVRANISACVCSLHGGSGTVPVAFSAYRVFKGDSLWNEGTLTGSDPADAAFGEGVVTWNDWSNDGEEWTTAGCNSADDGGGDNSGDGTGADRKATAEESVTITVTGTWCGIDVSAALAQDWYDGDANENGIVLIRTSGGYSSFNSTEYVATPSSRPFWVFTYEIASVYVRDVHLRKVQM